MISSSIINSFFPIRIAMKKILTGIFLLCGLTIFAQDLPEKTKNLVNDFSGTLRQDEIQTLENKLVSFNDSTSTQIAVVLIPSLEGYEIADYAYKLAEKWGIGSKDKNNGVLVLIAIQDRKARIEIGYGLEGVLPDAICRRIIENEMKPSFKQGNFLEGLDLATDAIIKFSRGEYTADNYEKKKSNSLLLLALVFLIFILFIYIRSKNSNNTKNGNPIVTNGLPWFMMMGGGRGGNWDSFSSGKGDFGGFGGGSFGGGGASGSW